jgi:hypothetical protein
MKKELNIKLVKLLIEFDFNLLEFNKKVFSNQGQVFNLKSANKSYLILNYINLLKSIKQVIRMFQFFKSNKFFFRPSISANSVVTLKLLNSFLKESNSSFETTVLQKKKHKNSIKFSLFLNKSFSEKDFVKTLQNKIFLLLELNKEKSSKDFGFYKILSDFNDWKKILFLALLIKHFKI